MHKMPGRIGDSPLIGLGLYADNSAGGCSMTGDGESIMRLALAHRIVNSMCNGEDADRAAEEAIAVMARRVGGEAGCIVLDRRDVSASRIMLTTLRTLIARRKCRRVWRR